MVASTPLIKPTEEKMKQDCPTPEQDPFWEEVRAAARLLIEWKVRASEPNAEKEDIKEASKAFARSIEALAYRMTAGNWLEHDEHSAWDGILINAIAWSADHQPELQKALRGLPREALLAVQNLGRAAYLALLTKTLLEPPHKDRFLQSTDLARFRCEGGMAVRPSDAISILIVKLLEAEAEAQKNFQNIGKFESYLRVCLNSQVRDLAGIEATIKKGEGHAAENRPDFDAERPSIILQKREAEDWLSAKMAELPALERATFVLKRYHGWNYTQISEILHGDSVRPEAGVDPEDRIARRKKRDAAAKDIERKLKKAIDELAKGEDDPSPDK